MRQNLVVLTGPATHRSLFERRRLSPDALLPGLVTMRGYERAWLRGDLLAGVTVAAYMIPQVMAYAQIAGLPPAVGLFGVIGPAVVYFFVGGARRLSVGPESTTALMTATAVGALAGTNPGQHAALAAALAVVVGVLCIVGWLVGLGFLADLLSKPVLIGYLAGVAVLMMVSQIEKVSGIPTPGDSLPAQVIAAVRNGPDNVHWPTLILAAALLLLLVIASRVIPKAPNALLAVMLATAAVGLFGLQRHGIQTVGPLPSSLPMPHLPSLSLDAVTGMLVPALGIAIVAYSDNVLTGRAFKHPQDPAPSANQELLGLGAANVAAGLTGGFAVSSSGSRTAIGVLVGARTQLYMLVAAAAIVASVFLLGPVLAMFPRAALGAIVVYAATRLVEWDEIRRIARYRRSELVLLLATTASVFFFGVLSGIGVAVALSLGDLVRRVARPHDAILGYVRGLGGMHDVADYPQAQQVPGLVIYRYDSPLFFANAEDFRQRAHSAVDLAATPAHWLLINAEANTESDITSLDTLAQLRQELADKRVILALARVKSDLRGDLMDHGVGAEITPERMYPTLPEAVRGYLQWHQARYGHLPRGVETVPDPASPAQLRDEDLEQVTQPPPRRRPRRNDDDARRRWRRPRR